jgi:hypothetical protein
VVREKSPLNDGSFMEFHPFIVDFPFPMDPSTFLGSVWGIIYYNLES